MITHGMTRGATNSSRCSAFSHLKCRQRGFRQNHLGKDSFPEANKVTIHCGRLHLTIQGREASRWPISPSSRPPARPILTVEKLEGDQAEESLLPPHMTGRDRNSLAFVCDIRSQWQTPGCALWAFLLPPWDPNVPETWKKLTVVLMSLARTPV